MLALHTTKRKIIAGGILVFVATLLVAGLVYMKSQRDVPEDLNIQNQEVSTESPVNIVLDFYNPWLDAVRSTSTDPYTLGLATETLLSESLRTRLLSTAGHAETDIDPVLCQTTTPERVTGRIVSIGEDQARVLVMAKEKELTAQSVFTLKRHNDGWFMDEISCFLGEFELPREFSFEHEGYLLKNVPPPLDPQFWHIVFEENNQLGHATPLLFDSESTCVATDTSEAVCAPDQFTEAVKIHVYGQMTETGVDVTRLEFIKEE